jgi:hypothetical protein
MVMQRELIRSEADAANPPMKAEGEEEKKKDQRAGTGTVM